MIKHPPYTKLMAWMKEAGVSAKELSILLGKSKSAVSKKINGTGSDFTVAEVRTICIEYKISADEFFVAYKVS